MSERLEDEIVVIYGAKSTYLYLFTFIHQQLWSLECSVAESVASPFLYMKTKSLPG